MKAIIRVSFGAKMQPVAYHVSEENDFIEIEIEYKDAADFEAQYIYYQNLVRTRVLKNAVQGMRDIKLAREEYFKENEA